MSILADIYNERYHAQASRPHYPQELKEKDLAFWEQATQALGGDVVDAHLYKLCEKENFNDIHHFREGFKLGVQLMLEVFGAQ